MTLEHVEGDLFDVGLPALGHGCNCAGSMSGGIAVDFRRLDERMYEEYARRCRDKTFRLGDVLPWQLDDGRIVDNLATEQRPGPDARPDAIRTSVAAMLADAEQRGLDRVGVPRLGSGIGGLEWSDVEAALAEVARPSRVVLTVATRPDQGATAQHRRDGRRRRPA